MLPIVNFSVKIPLIYWMTHMDVDKAYREKGKRELNKNAMRFCWANPGSEYHVKK